MKALAASILCAICFLGCSRGNKVHPIATIVGTNLFSTLEHPTRVEAFLLKQDESPGPPAFDRKKSGEYPIRTGPLVLSATLAKNISVILCNPNTYPAPTDSAKSCYPQFGVRLKFEGDAGPLDVLLCLECDMLALAPAGNVTGSKDFDPGRPQIVKFLKSVFPEDKIIQALRENRH